MGLLGVPQLPDNGDLSVLCGKPTKAELAIEENDAYGPQTVIKKFIISDTTKTGTDGPPPF